MNKKGQEGVIALVGIVFVVAFVVGIVCLFAGYDTVDASHRGVKNRFGELQGVMMPGMQWTGVFTHVEPYDLRLRKMTVEMLEGEKRAVDFDGQTVKARIEVNYKLNPESVEMAYSNIGRDKNLASLLNVDGIIREGFKTTTSKYMSKEIWQNRDKVKAEAIATISANFPNDYFILENIIISDLDFNPEFVAAIEQKKTNEELALAKDEETKIKTAEANMKIEVARGDAESRKLAADAEAYERLALAEAEAKSLALKSRELTPLMVQNNWIDAWKEGGAQVPSFVTGEGASNFLYNMNQGAGGIQ